MNEIMECCCLESRPRWIDFGYEYSKKHSHRYTYECSNCGEVIHKRIVPSICPNCKCKMIMPEFY